MCSVIPQQHVVPAVQAGQGCSLLWSTLRSRNQKSGLRQNQKRVQKVPSASLQGPIYFPSPSFDQSQRQWREMRRNKPNVCSDTRRCSVFFSLSVAPLVLANMAITDELSALDRELSMFPVRAFCFMNAGTVIIEQVITTTTVSEHVAHTPDGII